MKCPYCDGGDEEKIFPECRCCGVRWYFGQMETIIWTSDLGKVGLNWVRVPEWCLIVRDS